MAQWFWHHITQSTNQSRFQIIKYYSCICYQGRILRNIVKNYITKIELFFCHYVLSYVYAHLSIFISLLLSHNNESYYNLVQGWSKRKVFVYFRLPAIIHLKNPFLKMFPFLAIMIYKYHTLFVFMRITLDEGGTSACTSLKLVWTRNTVFRSGW